MQQTGSFVQITDEFCFQFKPRPSSNNNYGQENHRSRSRESPVRILIRSERGRILISGLHCSWKAGARSWRIFPSHFQYQIGQVQGRLPRWYLLKESLTSRRRFRDAAAALAIGHGCVQAYRQQSTQAITQYAWWRYVMDVTVFYPKSHLISYFSFGVKRSVWSRYYIAIFFAHIFVGEFSCRHSTPMNC